MLSMPDISGMRKSGPSLSDCLTPVLAHLIPLSSSLWYQMHFLCALSKIICIIFQIFWFSPLISLPFGFSVSARANLCNTLTIQFTSWYSVPLKSASSSAVNFLFPNCSEYHSLSHFFSSTSNEWFSSSKTFQHLAVPHLSAVIFSHPIST